VFREVFGWAKTDSTLAAMQQTVATWRPDLLHEAAELAGPLAAEAADVPHATVAMALRRTLTAWAPHVAAGAAPLATAIGLPADHDASRILDVPFATLVPPSLEAPDAAMPETVVRYGLTTLHPGGRVVTPRRHDAPLVWITIGTVAAGIPGVLDRVVPLLRAATTALPHVRFLLTTGSPDIAPLMPANVEVAAYVPQEEILAACDAVLGHGGFNTTMAALRHGKPQVVLPLFATDQFETATRLAEVGAAIAVIDPTPSDLRSAVERTPGRGGRAAAGGDEPVSRRTGLSPRHVPAHDDAGCAGFGPVRSGHGWGPQLARTMSRVGRTRRRGRGSRPAMRS
jgi:UDP:flavonoid glycosyltransferase YjiC (YdhE family)